MDGKIHQQDGVADDDAGQRDPADHRRGGEFGARNGVHGHDAEQGQGDRRHDERRNAEVAEFPHHQQIDEHQGHGEGCAHVAEGLIGHRPLTGPFDAGSHIIRRRPGPEDAVVFKQVDAVGGDVIALAHYLLDLQHAVDRRCKASAHIGDDIFDATKILVIDDVFLDDAAELTQFAQWHG